MSDLCPKCGLVQDALTGVCDRCGVPLDGQIALQPLTPSPPYDPLASLAPELDDTEEPLPRKTKGRGRRIRLLLAAGAFLVFFCIALSVMGGLAWWWFGSGRPDPMKFLPEDCQSIVAINVRQILDSEIYQQLQRDNADLSRRSDDLTALVGIPVTNMESVLIGTGSGSEAAVVIVQTRQPAEASTIRGLRRGVRFREVRVGNYTLYEETGKSLPGLLGMVGGAFPGFEDAASTTAAFCVVDRMLVVLGNGKDLRAVLQRDRNPDLPQGLRDALEHVDLSKSLVFAANRRDIKESGLAALGSFELDGLAGQVTVRDDINVELFALCKDAAAADKLRKLVDGWIGAGKMQAEQMRLLAGAEDFLDAAEVSARGRLVDARLQVKGQSIRRLIRENKPRGLPPRAR